MGKRIIPLILAGCIFLGGCALLAYPKLSQWLNDLHQSEVIADYSSTVDGLDEEAAEKELQRAADYNRELTDTVSLTDPFENKLEENDQYPTLLNFTAEGVMGYIEIPKINVLLPIYVSDHLEDSEDAPEEPRRIDEMLQQAELAAELSEQTGQNFFAFEAGNPEPVSSIATPRGTNGKPLPPVMGSV